MNGTFYVENKSVRGIPLSVDFTHPEDYFIFIFHIVFATSVFLLAGSVAIGILKTKVLRMQNRFVFMINTSISDVLTGISVYYLCLFDVQEGYPSRNSTFHVFPSLLGVNILTFMFAQFDRYCAVCHPFFYRRFICKPIVIGACVYGWFHIYIHLLLLNMVSASTASKLYSFGVISLQFIVVTKVAMTIKLYVIARYQLEREPPGPQRDNKKESLQILIFVVISFLTLWTPSFVNIIIKQWNGFGIYFRNEATNPFAIMARFNAISTSAIYLWGSPALRKAVQRVGWHKFLPQWSRKTLNENPVKCNVCIM